MSAGPSGRIKRALRNGLVCGWISDGVDAEVIESSNFEACQDKWKFELWCDGSKATDIFESHEALAEQGKGWAFYGKIPSHLLKEAADVSLVSCRDATRQTIDTTVVFEGSAGVDGIRPDGRVIGWALPGEGGVRALIVSLGGERVGTTLADRYHSEFPLECCDFMGFSIVIPVKTKRKGAGKSLQIHDADTGRCLVSTAFEQIPSLEGGHRGVLPVDVVASARVEEVFDEEAVASYIAKHGYEAFVRMAYAYLLERTADQGGLVAFSSDLATGKLKPINLMNNMLQSDERRRRGPFLGPYVGDPSYPFGVSTTSRGFNRQPLAMDVQDLAPDLTARLEKIEMAVAELELRSATPIQKVTAPTANFTYRENLLDRLLRLWQDNKAKRVLALADAARDKRDWYSAGRFYGEVLAVRPDLQAIWVQYGHALKETGRLAEAEASYRRAISINGAIADTYLQLGHVLKLQNRMDEARGAYRSATSLSSPGDPAGRYAHDELASLA